jgi:enoyl-CoA hydratase/carnithine racemase
MTGTTAEGGGASLKKLAERTHGVANWAQHIVWLWRELPVPVIAAVHGVAFGGGFQLTLGADMRYVAPDTRLSVMEVKWGLVPDMAGTQLMRHLAREDIVRELTYTGRIFSAQEALAYGFATRIVENPRAAAVAVAREIAEKSPDAIRAAKRLLNLAPVSDPRSGLLAEAAEQQALLGSRNQVEAVQANLEQRPAKFAGPQLPSL